MKQIIVILVSPGKLNPRLVAVILVVHLLVYLPYNARISIWLILSLKQLALRGNTSGTPLFPAVESYPTIRNKGLSSRRIYTANRRAVQISAPVVVVLI